MNKEKMGKYLKKLRKEKNISLEKLSEEFNKEYLTVSANAISNWENGKTIPDIDNLYFLSSYYGVSVDDILDGEKNEECDFEEKYFLHLPYSVQEERFKDIYNEPKFFDLITEQAISIRKRFKSLLFKYIDGSISRTENKELIFLINNYLKMNNNSSNSLLLLKAKKLKEDNDSNDEIWWELQKNYELIDDLKITFGQIADERYENKFISRMFDNLENWEKDMLLATLQVNDPIYFDPTRITSKAMEKYENEHNKEFDRERIYKDTIRYLIEHGACINTAYVGYDYTTTVKKRLIDEIEDQYNECLQPIYVSVYNGSQEIMFKVKNTARNRLFDRYRHNLVKPLIELGYTYDEIYKMVCDSIFEVPDEIYLRAAKKKGLDTNRDIKHIKADLYFDLCMVEDAWKELFDYWPTDESVSQTFSNYEKELQEGKTERDLFIAQWVGGNTPLEVERYAIEKNHDMTYQDYKNHRKIKRTKKILEELDNLTIDDIRNYYFSLGGKTDDQEY